MKLLVAFALTALTFANEESDLASRPAPPAPPAGAERNEFQTDVRKMLDILINSLYTNRNIFLRELISNAADALDKVRFLYLTTPKEPVNQNGEAPTTDIRIHADKETHTLVLRDGGVGMTKEDLMNNLGKIGSSGTKQFLEKISTGSGASQQDMALIGQFGVGFYSAFLVADKVVVASKSDDSETQWVWESSADGEYTIYEDPRGNTLGRGTEITLYLKEDADEYLEDHRLRDIASRYSEFIHFPIFLRKEIDAASSAKAAEDAATEDSEKPAAEEDAAADEWVRLNEQKPIWTRKSADVTDEDYEAFYKALSKDYEAPLAWDHFSAEGEVEFKAIIYIPATAPAKLFEAAANVASSIKLYVRRVFITDDFKDMLPRYLAFIAGVVDSDDLPLNVSREILQESRILKIIKKKLIRKVLSLIKDLADKDAAASAEYREKLEAAADEDAKKEITKPVSKYPKFWEQYGKAIRLGLIDDAANRARLAKLLRYKSTKALATDEWRSLEEYVDDMITEQDDIYFIVGLDETAETLAKKPFLQKFKRLGIEVLLMTEAIDEYVVGHMPDFAGKKLVNLAKEDVTLPGETEELKKTATRRKKANADFLEWFRGVLGRKIEKVVLSDRLVDAPAIVVSSKFGMTANMATIMRGTALGDQANRASVSKVLEVNINHPVIRAIRDASREDPEADATRDAALLIYETALFESGYALDDVKDFVTRMQASVGKSLGVTSFDPLEDEELPPEEEAADDKAEEVNEDDADEVQEAEASPSGEDEL